MKQEEKTIEKAVEALNAIKAQYKVEVIKDYEIPPLVNMRTGATTGFGVELQLNTKYDYDEATLNDWKDKLQADERKDYFKVQVRREWVEDMKLKKSDTYYIVAANDVGQAKERIALLLDILKAEQEKEQGFKVEDDSRTTIRKAMPFEVDCIVPKEFSDLFYEKPTK